MEAYYFWDGLVAVGEFQIHRVRGSVPTLWAFEVYPGHRRKGHARRMLEEAKRLAGDELSLLVKADNGAAIELYKGSGFRDVFLDEVADEYLMVWKKDEAATSSVPVAPRPEADVPAGRARRPLVRFLPHASLVQWLLVANAIALALMLAVLLRVLRVLHIATCVIGGEDLFQCLTR